MAKPEKTVESMLSSPLGMLQGVCTDEGVCALRPIFQRVSEAPRPCSRLVQAHPLLAMLQKELDEYFYEGRRVFSVPIVLKGRVFERRVLGALKDVPFGTVCTYGALAFRVDNAKAARAVGGALGNNALMILVPCHRVVRADGTMGGFAYGSELKSKLLGIEGVFF